MKKNNVGIVDDHLLFAEGISNIITQSIDLNLSFITSSAFDLFELLKLHQIDFLLLDVNLPNYNGMDILKKLKMEEPQIKIMILTMYQPIDIGLDLKTFNGDAYVLKISGKNILLEALQCMKSNVKYFDPNIIHKLNKEDSFTNQLKLTKREKEIIALISIGKTSREIADQLFLSELTIKTHRKNINEKMGTKSVAQLISKVNSN